MSSDSGEGEKKGKGDLAGVAKWVVIGIVLVTFLILFRGELGRLLERAEEVKLTTSGIEIKTAQTPLGKAEVSNVSVKPAETVSEGIHGSSYVSHKHDFQISWPSSGWNASDTIGRSILQQYGLPPTVEMPIAILGNELVGNFRPNVNVVVETVGTMAISNYVNLTVQGLEQQGWKVLSRDTDEATQGAFISFYSYNQGYKLYQFQRIAISKSRAYVITASQLPPEDSLSQKLREELLGILNSFRVIS